MATTPVEFRHGAFSCAVEIFRRGDDIVVRFFDAARDHAAEQIMNYVVCDPGLGFLCLRFKGENGLLSGFLVDTVFANEAIVEAAVDFTMSLSPKSESAYIPFHIDRIRLASYVEYNGEY
jgi:hypothetical protein